MWVVLLLDKSVDNSIMQHDYEISPVVNFFEEKVYTIGDRKITIFLVLLITTEYLPMHYQLSNSFITAFNLIIHITVSSLKF